MSNLQDPNQQELQKLRTDIVAFLRTSRLAENYKKSLVIMLPYMSQKELQSAHEKLTKENISVSHLGGISAEQFQRFQNNIRKIKQTAYKNSEKQLTPSAQELDQQLLSQLSQV